MSAFTPAQRDAITLAENLAVTAGAGAGKTRVLVERFIRLLEEPAAELERLIAITFTEKAAREMRDRVRETLHRRARHPDPQVARPARRLLDRLERARIQTFHSFCQSLLRAFPVEAALDPDFRVVDELEAGLLLADAVDAVLDEAIAAGGEAIVDLLARYSLPALSGGLSHLITRLRSLGLSVEEARRLTRETEAAQAAELPALRQAVAQAVQAVLDHPAKPGSKGHEQQAWLRERWEPLRGRVLDEVIPELRALCDSIDGRTRLPKAPLAEAIDHLAFSLANPEARQVAEALLTLAEAALSRYHSSLAAADLVDMTGLVERAHDLLLRHPEIRDEWSGRCRLAMVDEFQDTDLLQWRIIWLLLGEPLPADRLFVVGDAKQSIYRFRGARVELFAAAAGEIAAAGGRTVDLDINFRSQGGLVRFVNHLFGGLMPGYQPMQPHRPEREPAVELLLATPGERRATRAQEAELVAARIRQMVDGAEQLVWEPPAEPGGAERPRPVRYGDVAILLQAMTHVNEYALALGRAGVPHYVVAGNGFFDQQEILDLYNLLTVLVHPEDPIALLGVLRSPYGGLSDEAVYLMGQHPGSLPGALADPDFRLPEGEQPLLEHLRRLLPRLRQIAWQEPLADVLPALYAAAGIYPVLAALPGGARQIANLEKLAARVRTFGQAGRHQLADLLRWLQICREQAVREGLAATEDETGNTVRIMTVHKAKGLEFPVVILPDLTRTQQADRDLFLIHPEVGLAPMLRHPHGEERRSRLREAAKAADRAGAEAEYQRLFYVAATRARDYLVLSGCPPTRESAATTWLNWLAAACGADLAAPPAQVSFGPVTARVVTAADLAGSVESPADAADEVAAAGPDSAAAAGEVAAAGPPDHSAEFLQPPGAGVGEPFPPELVGLVRQIRPVAPVRERDGLQVGVTRLLDYQDCARKYYLKYVLQVPDLRRGLEAADPWLAAEPLAAGEPEEAGAEAALEPTVRGQIVHSVCERLEHPAELEDLIRQAAHEHKVDPDSAAFAAEVREPLERYLASDLFAQVRGAERVLSEVPVRLQVGHLTLEGQIDKVLVAGGRATVVDFKTNQVEDEAHLAELAAHYQLQMQVYALCVERLMGLRVEQAVLYFMGPGQAVSVPVDAAAVRARLEEMGEELAGAHRWEDYPPAPAHCPACQYRELCRIG